MTSMMKYAVTVMYIGNFKDIVPKKGKIFQIIFTLIAY